MKIPDNWLRLEALDNWLRLKNSWQLILIDTTPDNRLWQFVLDYKLTTTDLKIRMKYYKV